MVIITIKSWYFNISNIHKIKYDRNIAHLENIFFLINYLEESYDCSRTLGKESKKPNIFVLWKIYISIEMGVTLKGRKLNFCSLKGALCQIWFKLVHCFWEEKMSKTKMLTTDKFLLEKITWNLRFKKIDKHIFK